MGPLEDSLVPELRGADAEPQLGIEGVEGA